MKQSTLFLVPLLLFLFPSAPSAGTRGFKVIVNPESHVTSLTKKEVSRLFLKKVKTWDNDLQVIPVNLPVGSPARDRFAKEIHNKAPVAVKAYWQQRVFSGRDVPPVERKSDASVVAFVRANPGAIGYVSENTDVQGLTVLAIK